MEIDKIFTFDLMLTTYRQIDGEDFINFLENMNFIKIVQFDVNTLILTYVNWTVLEVMTLALTNRRTRINHSMTRPQCSNVQNIISELDGYWGAFIVDMYIIHIMTYYYYDILCITYHDNRITGVIVNGNKVKFIHSEKTTNVCEITTVDLSRED